MIRIIMEAFNGKVNDGDRIDLPCADWINGMEVQCDHGSMWFELVDVNENVMAILPYIATLPKSNKPARIVEYYFGPYLNRNSTCPIVLRVHTEGKNRVPLRFVVKGIGE